MILRIHGIYYIIMIRLITMNLYLAKENSLVLLQILTTIYANSIIQIIFFLPLHKFPSTVNMYLVSPTFIRMYIGAVNRERFM
jgi:hypothetical protein